MKTMDNIITWDKLYQLQPPQGVYSEIDLYRLSKQMKLEGLNLPRWADTLGCWLRDAHGLIKNGYLLLESSWTALEAIDIVQDTVMDFINGALVESYWFTPDLEDLVVARGLLGYGDHIKDFGSERIGAELRIYEKGEINIVPKIAEQSQVYPDYLAELTIGKTCEYVRLPKYGDMVRFCQYCAPIIGMALESHERHTLENHYDHMGGQPNLMCHHCRLENKR